MNIFELFENAANPGNVEKMAAYMKNNFPFLGIPKPERAKISRDFLKAKKKDAMIDWAFVWQCYAKPEREFHYLALAYLDLVKNLLVAGDLAQLEKLIVTNSWWDSVDSIDALVGEICLRYPEEKRNTVGKWIGSDNIWLKRVAIDFQLRYKEKTDTERLSLAILGNLNTGEFFVDKAIGWSLREYSKVNPTWVRQFVAENQLSALSKKEACKYL